MKVDQLIFVKQTLAQPARHEYLYKIPENYDVIQRIEEDIKGDFVNPEKGVTTDRVQVEYIPAQIKITITI